MERQAHMHARLVALPCIYLLCYIHNIYWEDLFCLIVTRIKATLTILKKIMWLKAQHFTCCVGFDNEDFFIDPHATLLARSNKVLLFRGEI